MVEVAYAVDGQSSIHLRKQLNAFVTLARWPAGIGPSAFHPERHAEAVHCLLAEAYADWGGVIGPFSAWWAALRDDEEFDPCLIFLATDAATRVVGVAQCWTSAFIKDLAVAQAWRRRGIGEALLMQAFGAFYDRGAACVDLKVLADNPSGAGRLYARLGMLPVARAAAMKEVVADAPDPVQG